MRTTTRLMAKHKKTTASLQSTAPAAATRHPQPSAHSTAALASTTIPGRFRVNVHVKAGASTTSISAPMPLSMHSDGPLEMRIGAPPEGGKANIELVQFLEDVFSRVSSQTGGSGVGRVTVDVQVVQGMTSRNKVLTVSVTPPHGATEDQLWAALVLEASHR